MQEKKSNLQPAKKCFELVGKIKHIHTEAYKISEANSEADCIT